MGRQILLQLPEELELEDVVRFEAEVKERLKAYIMLAKLNRLIEELNLTEEDWEKFQKTKQNVWKKYKREYAKKGVL